MMSSAFRIFVIGTSFLAAAPLLADPPKMAQTQIKGLLVIELPNGSFAGTATQMNATSLAIDDDEKKFDVGFNQEVGPLMAGATREVEKLMLVRHTNALPTGRRIEFGFADKHSAKDGPSAAVACALMAESIITGKALDQSFAVTGDLTATGEVRPIGGVSAKVRGASKYNCNLVVVPDLNKAAIQDIYVLEGIKPLIQAQIITIKTFDEAWALAQAEKDPQIQQALDDFQMVQTVLKRNLSGASHPKVLEKLKGILKVLPNHESARLIALDAMKRGPKKLSLSGSLSAIEEAANELAATVSDGSYMESGLDDKLRANAHLLSRMRDDVDPRTKAYLLAFVDTANFIINNRNRRQWNETLDKEFKASIRKINTERDNLKNDTEIRSELMDQ